MLNDFSDFLRDYRFLYDESQIANHPVADRSSSRLLVVRKNPSAGMPRFEEMRFSDLPLLIKAEPELQKKLWVRNRSRVFWARIYALRKSGSRHEILLLEKLENNRWKAMIRHSAKIKFPEELIVEGTNSPIIVESSDSIVFPNAESVIESVGRVPLPPYIRRESQSEDRERYQTVWAQGEAKSAAAPTASLHFSNELWHQLELGGVSSADVYLHVGLGTFEPVRSERLSEHELHAEAFDVSKVNAERILSHEEGVLAVGTTACRLVETLAIDNCKTSKKKILEEDCITGKTSLFIRPSFEFKKTQALLTNFHLPESTLFVLVSVFAGSLALTKEAYRYAVDKKFRLFSYGDASIWF